MKLSRRLTAAATTMALAATAFSSVSFMSSSAADVNSLSAMELVNAMGSGINLGNNFDCFGTWANITTADDQITMWGGEVPTKETIQQMHKQGFDTIRIPVTWMAFIDDEGNVDSAWMARVKEVVDWAIDDGMYVILNVHHDGVSGNWLSNGTSQLTKYKGLWTNIANEFKDYDNHLVFEGMNEITYESNGSYDYTSLLTMNQAFVDTVRATGSNNAGRLLLIPGANTDLTQTCSDSYKMPTDSANMLAVSIHYYLPSQFCVEEDSSPWTWTDDSGTIHTIEPQTEWGSEEDYKTLLTNFETMKSTYTSKNIPVILGECGVLTEQQKDADSIREFIEAVYSMSYDYDGFATCLWDTSKDNAGDMNFFYRGSESFTATAGSDSGTTYQPYTWYDTELGDFFKSIKQGNYVHYTDYTSLSNSETTTTADDSGNLQLSIGTKEVSKVIFNATIDESNANFSNGNYGFGVATSINGTWTGTSVGGASGVKQSDGTYTYELSISDLEGGKASDYIQCQNWWGDGTIVSINSLTVEFAGEGSAQFDYSALKSAINAFTPTYSAEETTEAPTEEQTTVEDTTAEPTTEEVTSTTEVEVEPTEAPEESISSTTVEASLYGDVNADGIIDVGDVILLNKSIVQSATLTDLQKANADAYKDGVIDSNDALTILRHLVMSIESLPYIPE
jgi:endoglucanase